MATKDLQSCIREDIRVMRLVLESLQFTNTFPKIQTILHRRIDEAQAVVIPPGGEQLQYGTTTVYMKQPTPKKHQP